MNRKGFFIGCLVLLSAVSLLSCENETIPATTENESASETTTAVNMTEKPEYPGELQNYNSYEFRILNLVDDMWNSNTMILDADDAGDKLHTAVHETIRSAEEELNISIRVTDKYEIFDLVKQVQKTVLADEDAYDMAYVCSVDYLTATASVVNLYEIPTINLSAEWWSQSYVDSMTVGNGNLYGAPDYLNMFTQDCVTGMFVNIGKIKQLDLELPYQEVRNGTWTFDCMSRYMKASVNINGDTDFEPKASGSCFYGLIGNHEETGLTMLEGANCFILEKGTDNLPVIRENMEPFYSTFTKMASVFETPGYYALINTESLIGGDIFAQGRAMFYSSGIGYALGAIMRNTDTEYGVLPMPKADENQSDYISPMSQYGMVAVVPKTNSDTARTGTIMDYLSWKGYQTIYSVLQEDLCYKGVRDEDSIDMLNIISDSKTIDIGYLFGISKELQTKIAKSINDSHFEIASAVEKSRKSVTKSLEKFVNKLSES